MTRWRRFWRWVCWWRRPDASRLTARQLYRIVTDHEKEDPK